MIDKKIEKTYQKEDKNGSEPLDCGTGNAREKVVADEPKDKRKENSPLQKFLYEHGYKIEIFTFPATVALVVWLSARIHASLGQAISLAGICFGIYYVLFGLIAGFEFFVNLGIMTFFAGIITLRPYDVRVFSGIFFALGAFLIAVGAAVWLYKLLTGQKCSFFDLFSPAKDTLGELFFYGVVFAGFGFALRAL